MNDNSVHTYSTKIINTADFFYGSDSYKVGFEFNSSCTYTLTPIDSFGN